MIDLEDERKKVRKNLDFLIEDLKKRCKEKDPCNEEIHQLYDFILRKVAYHFDPEIVDELDDIVRDITFWYA